MRAGGTARLIDAVRQHPEGRAFQAALDAWLVRAAARPLPALRPLPDESAAEVCRCSVVINTVGRPAELERTLEDLAGSWDARDELLIVLGPGDDESAGVVTGSALPCKLLHCGVRNLAVSRNLGLRAARGKRVVFLDDDASPERGWIEALLAAFERDASVAVVAGFVRDAEGQRFLDRYVVSDLLGGSCWLDDASDAACAIEAAGPGRAFLRAVGCNMAFDRIRLLQCGGFDPAYAYFLEETDAVLRLWQTGASCVAAPDARVRHRLASNPVRSPDAPADRLPIVRSQLHFLHRHAFGKAPASAIGAAVWLRVLEALERIARSSGPGRAGKRRCGEGQRETLALLASELREVPGRDGPLQE